LPDVCRAAGASTKPDVAGLLPARKLRTKHGDGAFAQILGKLYFFQLRENLRRILVDYGQKHTRRTNAAFNAAC